MVQLKASKAATGVSAILGGALESADGALWKQLAGRIRNAIQGGALGSGDRLPSSRILARDLGVARGTVTAALEVLLAEGLLESRAGSGIYVTAEGALLGSSKPASRRNFVKIRRLPVEPDTDPLLNCQIDFRPCRPSLEAFPTQVWSRCLSLAGSGRPQTDYPDAAGDPLFRQAIADYLRRARGLNVGQEEIIVTNGAVNAMHLLSELFLEKGSKVVVENPGYPLAWQTFRLSGATITPCAVDDDGLIVERLPVKTGNVRLVYVTPSHQFPTGSRLSLARRQELIRWAEEKGALVVEDDYDGEFRYDVPPLPPMAAMPNNCVVYCGTFSKSLFPGLRLGFACGPKHLIRAMAQRRTLTEYAPNTVLQTALRFFVNDGHFERHIQRMRRLYSLKREAVAATVGEFPDVAELCGLESGLSAMIRLRSKKKASAVADAARKIGIWIPSVARYAVGSRTPDDALIAGYAEPSVEAITSGLHSVLKTL